MRRLSQLVLLLTLSGCTSSSTKQITKDSRESHPKEMIEAPDASAVLEVKSETATPAKGDQIPVMQAPGNAPSAGTIKSTDCKSLNLPLPYFLEDLPAIVLEFRKRCDASDGTTGFLPGSSWTAMGVPCTGGLGRIDRRGDSGINNPSVVTFQIGLNCPMAPVNQQELEHHARQKLNLSKESMAAFYPMTVEYWEFVETKDSGIGSNPTLLSATGLARWQKWVNQKGVDFPVRLYGQESAWGQSHAVYEVDGMIQPENRSQYILKIKSIKKLTRAEASEVLARCKARPNAQQVCQEIFAN